MRRLRKALSSAWRSIKNTLSKVWNSIKSGLKKVWAFIKKNWFAILVIVLAVVAFFFPVLIPFLMTAVSWIGSSVMAVAGWLGPGWSMLLGLGILTKVNPDLAHSLVSTVGEVVGGGIGAIGTGVGAALSSSGFLPILLIVGGVWVYSKLSHGESEQ